MENLYINHFAVVVCAIANLALGALWYSPVLFYKGWLSETGLNDGTTCKIKSRQDLWTGLSLCTRDVI